MFVRWFVIKVNSCSMDATFMIHFGELVLDKVLEFKQQYSGFPMDIQRAISTPATI